MLSPAAKGPGTTAMIAPAEATEGSYLCGFGIIAFAPDNPLNKSEPARAWGILGTPTLPLFWSVLLPSVEKESTPTIALKLRNP